MMTSQIYLNKPSFLICTVTAIMLNLVFIIKGVAQSPMEGYYLKTTNYPGFDNLWTLNGLADGEVQGVTHDKDNWFFTWTYNNIGYLIKLPVEEPINDNVLQNPKVRIVNMNQFSALEGYWHWGDPDYYLFNGQEFIVVPITGKGVPLIAIFRASDMKLLAYGKLNKQNSTGWCAVNPNTGILYTSEDFNYKPIGSNCDNQSFHFLYPRNLLLYNIPWEILSQSEYFGEIELGDKGTTELLKENGGQIELYNMQGGEFTPSGETLYISSGSGCCSGIGAGQQYEIDGIRAFNTLTWKEIERSNNRKCNCSAPKYFDFAYLGCDGAGSWSPQGLTIWDLDNGRAPNIRGQLHVMLFKYRVFGENRQVMMHYTNRLYVDARNGIDQPLGGIGDDALPGTSSIPFKTLTHTINYYPIWNGTQITLRSGEYPTGPITINKRVLITSTGGAATIK